jgi:hypothetical protein
MLRIKYPQFLNCCKYVPPGTDSCVMETIESLAYGNQDSKHLALVLEKNGNNYEDFITTIIEKYNLPVRIENDVYISQSSSTFKDEGKIATKKKAIKDIMVENYLIKMKRDKGLSIVQVRKILLKINLRLFLKMLPLKNILIEDGEIISVSDPVIDDIDDTSKEK